MPVLLRTSPNFKSHIKTNDYCRAAIDAAKNDLTPSGFHRRGINTLNALEGSSHDGKHDFVEFFQKDGRVYTNSCYKRRIGKCRKINV